MRRPCSWLQENDDGGVAIDVSGSFAVNQNVLPCPAWLLTPIWPVHLLHQSSADGEPQTCPAKAASGGAVGLREGLEQSRLHILGNADAGISDGEP